MADHSLRVLLDCRMADWTGVGRYTRSLANALAADPTIELVRVVAAARDEMAQQQKEYVATRHPFTPAGSMELGRIARDVAPDVLHCMHFPTSVPAYHPLVVTIHDLIPLTVPGVMPSASRRYAYRLWNRRALRVADITIAVSHHTAAEIARFSSAKSSKVHVVHEAADDFTTGPVGSPPHLARVEGQPYLLAFGNPRPHKGLSDLLYAFRRISDEFPDVALMLVGREVPEVVHSVLGDTTAASRVFFTGFVEDDELRALYRDCLAFVFPSHSEGFGLPPLEAMGMGAPVVTTSAASIPEVVGDAALRFEAGDSLALAEALAQILGESGLRERLIERGHTQAAGFTWARAAEESAALYRRAVERGGR